MPSKPDHSDSTNQPTAELRRLVSDLLDEQISSQQHERLAELLRGDETARAYYLDQMANHAVLQWDMTTAPSVERDPATTDQSHQDHVRQSMSEFEPGLSTALNHLVNDADVPHPKLTSLALGELHEIAEADRRKPKTILMWLRGKKKKQQQGVAGETHEGWNLRPMMQYAAAAAIVLVVSLTLILWPRQGAPPIAKKDVVTIPEQTILVESRDAEWSGDMKKPRAGEPLPLGDLRLVKGLAHIRFASGVESVIEGPATFSITGKNTMEMQQGSVVARVPIEARGFTVLSPRMKVIDLGTEFGMKVDEKQIPEVHVFEGAVEVSKLDDHGAVLSTQRLGKHQARRFISSDRDEEPVTFGETPFVHTIDHPELNITESYVASVKKLKPLVYLRFDGYDGFAIPNAVSRDQFARVVGTMELGGNTANRFVYFDSQTSGLHVKMNDYLQFEGDAYTIEFWIRPDAVHHGALVALERDESSHCVYVELGDAEQKDVERRSRVRFLHRNPPGKAGGTNVFSASPYTPGRWQHIVAVKKGNEMKLYVNGQIVARGSDSTTLHSPCRLVLGQLTSVSTERRYLGALDEVAVYPRALSEKEIMRHHRLVAP